ncbi:MAG: hypothetical protein C0596_19045 [Marinilabiliales bacterium]|nr:MAG: hypothetical protein C0596_19045 [Marinilabiliales bacterium]
MKLKEYIRTVTLPNLSYHIEYSKLFEKQYDNLTEKIIPYTFDEKPIALYCWKNEFDEFIELLRNKRLTYKDKIVGENDNFDFLIEYSKYFEQGFDSINYDTPISVIISHIPFCTTLNCIYPENPKKPFVLGRKAPNSKPCIAGNRPVTLDYLTGQGILASKTVINNPKSRILKNPQKTAYSDGVMFKSIFQIIERYPEFKEQFSIEEKQNETFVEILLKGVHEIQNQDVKCEGIRIIKNTPKKSEESFRDWFKTFLTCKYESVNSESPKGNGRIDLKIEDKSIGTKIIEFKGWWNKDKNVVPKQILKYLTDFEKYGYIIMINHCKSKKIDEEYLNLIMTEEMGFVKGSYGVKEMENSGFTYYLTKHDDQIRIKTLCHIILNVY